MDIKDIMRINSLICRVNILVEHIINIKVDSNMDKATINHIPQITINMEDKCKFKIKWATKTK